MNKNIFAIMTALLTLSVGSVQAEGSLDFSDLKMNAGTRASMEVTLSTDVSAYAGFQFDLVLPIGITLVGESLVKEQTGDMVCNRQIQTDGGIRMVVFSPSLKTAHGGKVMALQLKADKKAVAGDYPIRLENIVLTDAGGKTVRPAAASAVAKIFAPVTVTAKSVSRSYGEDTDSWAFDMSDNYAGGEPVISCEATALSPVGTYDIVVGKGSIEADTVTLVNATLTVTKAPLTVKVGAYQRKQGEDNPEFTVEYEGFRNGETAEVLTKLPIVETEAGKGAEPGIYTLNIKGAEADNYDISYTSGRLTVTEADPITLTAISYSREYGEPNPDFGFVSDGAALKGVPVIECEASEKSPVGTYGIVIKKGSVENYNDTYVGGTLTVTKAPLTVWVEDAEREQGVENPQFVIGYAGWKNGDTEQVLTVKPTVTTDATKDSPAGEYVITCFGGEADNYEMSYREGKLTITVPDGIGGVMRKDVFDVYDARGRKVRRQATSLRGLSRGVYIVNRRKIVISDN